MTRLAPFLLLLLCSCAVSGYSQYPKCPELPETYSWTTAEEYAQDRELVKKTLRWLCKTPLGAEIQDRSLANAFVMEWLAGTPEFTLDICTEVLPAQDLYPELLFSFIHGMALYRMEHRSGTDSIRLHIEGLKAVTVLVEQSKEMSHSRELRKLLKASRKNRLKEYVTSVLPERMGGSSTGNE